MTRTAAARPDRRLGTTRRRLALTSALGATLLIAAPAWAQSVTYGDFGTVTGVPQVNPGGAVPIITATPTDAANPLVLDRLDVNLNARNTLIEWTGFNVAQNRVANFNDTRAVGSGGPQAVLNRVTGGQTSIDGQINSAANTQVWIINTGGILIGGNARFNVGGLVLSTLALAPRETGRNADTDFLASNGSYDVRLQGTSGAITGGAGAAQLNLRSGATGVLALVAPSVTLDAKLNSGVRQTAFALASDVRMSLSAGGPLSVTLNAGTTLGSKVAGTVVGDAVYALISPDEATNVLLDMPATVSNATVDARGVVVLAGTGLNAGVVFDPAADPVTSDRLTINNGDANAQGSATLGSVLFAPAIGSGTAPPVTRGVTVAATGTANVGAIRSGTAAVSGALGVRVADVETSGGLSATSASGTTTVAGTVTVGGDYTASGAAVVLGTSSGLSGQIAAGQVRLVASAGSITSLGSLTLVGDSNDTGDEMQIGGTGTTGLALAGSTIRSGSAGGSAIRFGTATNNGQFDLGNIDASALLQATVATPGITRIGAISFDGLRLTGAANSSISSGNAADLLVRNGLNLASTATTTLSGRTVTVNGETVGTGSLTISSGQGGASTAALSNTGSKRIITSGDLLVGGSISGGGTVGLSTSTSKSLRVTGSIGSLGAAVGNVAINGGLVEIGTMGVAGGIASSGTVIIGSPTLSGSLTIRGELQSAGQLLALVAGPVDVGDLSLAGANNRISAYTQSGTIKTGAITLTQAAGGTAAAKSLLLEGTGVIVGTLGEANGVTGSVTINATNGATLASSDLSSLLSVAGGSGDASFTTLSGSGAKSITSGGTTSGGAITGAGGVTLAAGATGALTLTGDVGTAGAPVASLTIDRGGTVQLAAVHAAGAASLGQLNTLGSLSVNGALTAGSLFSRTSGTTTFAGAIDTTGGIDVGATGAAAVRAGVTAGGDYVVSGGSVTLGTTGVAVLQQAAGAVTLTSGTNGVIAGRSGLTLTANSNDDTGAGAEALRFAPGINGSIDFVAGTAVNGGSGRQSAIYVGEGNSAVNLAGAINARVLAASAGTSTISRSADVRLGSVNVVESLDVFMTNPARFEADRIDLTGAGSSVRITTAGTPLTVNGPVTAEQVIELLANGGALTAGALTAGTNVVATSTTTTGGVETGGAVQTGAILAGGDVEVRGGSVSTGAIGTDAAPIGGAVTVGTISSNLTSPVIVANGTVTLTAGTGGGAPRDLILATDLRSNAGALALTGDRVVVGAAGATNTLRAATGLTMTARAGTIARPNPSAAGGTSLITTGGAGADITLAADAIDLGSNTAVIFAGTADPAPAAGNPRANLILQSSGAALGTVSLPTLYAASLGQRVGAGGTLINGINAADVLARDIDLVNSLRIAAGGLSGVGLGDVTVRGAGQGIAIDALNPSPSQQPTFTAGLLLALDGDVSVDVQGPARASFVTGIDVGIRSRAGLIGIGSISAKDDVVLRAGGTITVNAIETSGSADRAGVGDGLRGATLVGGQIDVAGQDILLGQSNGVATTAPGAITLAAAGDVTLRGLAGAGTKTVVAGGSIRGFNGGGADFATSGAGAVTLTAGAAGEITLASVSATGDKASALTINGASQATVNGAVNVGGQVNVGQDATRPTGALTVTGALAAGALAARTTNAVRLAGATTTAGAIALTAGTSIDATSLRSTGDITLGGIAADVTTIEVGSVNAGGNFLANTARLASVQLTGPSTVAGQTGIFTSGAAALGTLASTDILLVLAGGDITFTALSGAGAKVLSTLSIGNGAVSGGTISGGGPVVLQAGAGSPIDVGAITDPIASLRIDGGSLVTIGGPVTVTGATSISEFGAVLTNALRFTGALTTGALDSRTAGEASFASVTAAAGMGGTISVRSQGGGAITFAGAVNGGGQLSVNTAGTTTFGGAVGDLVPVASVAAVGTGPIVVNGGSVRSVGTQTYGGTVTLGAATTLTGTTGSFAGGVNGGVGFNDLTLTFSGDSSLIADPFTNVGNLVVDGGGTTALAGNVTTRGFQRWADAIRLDGATTLRSTAGGAITLSGLSGASALTVATAGTATFGAGASGLASIVTTDTGTTVLSGTLSTVGAQSYGPRVLLASDVTVRTTVAAGDAASFAGTVDASAAGGQALTVTTGGRTVFGGAVGGLASLSSLTVDGGGTTVLNGGSVRTVGAQTYADALSLGADTVLTGASGSFAGGVAGNGFDLTLNFGGATRIGPNFGGIDDLDVGGAAVLAGSVTTTGGQRYRGAVTLDGPATLRSGPAGTGPGAMRFDSTINGGQALTIATAGPTSFNGAVGDVAPLASLGVDGGGAIAFNAGIPAGGATVSTAGPQSYTGATTLGADARLVATAGSIGFAGTIDGAHGLSVAAGGTGDATFAGQIGGIVALTALGIEARAVSTPATGNRVGTLAASVRGGGLTFDNAAALAVGTVGGVSGISTSAGTVLTVGDRLTLARGINGGASLAAVGITQNSGAAISAGSGLIALDGRGGPIVLGDALSTTDAGVNAVRIVNASSLQLGPLTAAGTVTLGGGGAGAITGTITQGGSGGIVAATLTGNAGGAVTLTNAGNNLGTLGSFSANGFALRDANGLVVAGPVSAGSGDLTLTTGGGTLSLPGALTASSGTVTLVGAGPIIQGTGAGSGIVAARLTGSSAGGAALRSAGNAVGTLAGFTNAGTGGFDLVNSVALAITGDVDGGQALSISAPGIAFDGRTLRASGPVTLAGGAGSVTGATVTAGADLTVSGVGVDIGSASAGSGAAGVLRVTTGTGLLRLGTGFAGQRVTLNAGGDLTVATSLTAGTVGNIGSASTVDATAVGLASVARAVSNNGGASIVGGRTTVGSAAAINGALLVEATDGALLLGSGTARTSATISAIGAAGQVEVRGLVEAGTTADVAARGLVRLATVDAAGATTVRSTAGAVEFAALQGAGGKSVTAATAIGGGAIAGAGGVTLVGGPATGAANTITVGAIGASAPVASLTVNGGSQVTLGTPGGTINVAGATRIGQSPGAATGALTVNGSLRSGALATGTAGDARFGDLTLDATGNTVTAGGQIVAGAVSLVGGGARSLVLTGDAGVSTGAIANAAGTIGTVTVDADAAAGEARVASTNLAGTLTIAGGTAGASFGALAGSGDKLVSSTGAIRGTAAAGTGASIDGGAVTLVTGSGAIAGNTVQLDAVGTARQVAALTINGGSAVTLGGAGATGTTVSVAGATRIGVLANGAATGALTINGAVDSDGSFTAVAAGPVRTGAIDSVGALAMTAGSDLTFGALTGAGNKTLTAGGAIAGAAANGGGASIDGGEVRLRAGPSTVAANTVRLDSIGAGAATAILAINGGSNVAITGPVTLTGPMTVGQGTGAGDLTGALRVDGPILAPGGVTVTTTGEIRLASVTSTQALTLTTTGAGGEVRFDALNGDGEKRLIASGGIIGGAVTGTGAVTLAPSATGNVTIASVGTDAARAASLTVTRGGAVQIGPVFTSGAASFGQAAALGSLDLGPASVGSLGVTSIGSAGLTTVASSGLVSVTTTGAAGDVIFTALTGTGEKRLSAGRSIGGPGLAAIGASISGGIVGLTAATASATGVITLDTVAATSLAISGGATTTLGRPGSTGDVVTVSGAAAIGQTVPIGALTVNGGASAGSFQSATSGATVLTGGVTATSGAIGIAAGSVQAQMLTAAGAVGVAAVGDATLVGGSSGGAGDFAVTAGNVARISGGVGAGGAYRVRGASVSLGSGATAQGARGLVDIATTGGTLTGSDGLTLTSNADGAGNEYLAIDAAGSILFGGVALVGGTAGNASDISVVERASGAAVTLGTVTGRQLGSFNAARTAIGTLATSGAVTATGLVNVQRSLGISSIGGAIQVDEARVTDAGQGITLATTAPAGGAITARLLSANSSGGITVDARAAAQIGTSSGGATAIRGASVGVGTATARGTLGLSSTAGGVTLGTGDASGATVLAAAGGDVEVTTRLTAGGGATISTTGAARLSRVQATTGNLDVTAAGAATGVGAGRADLSAIAGSLRVQAGGAALLGPLAAANAIAVQAAAIDASSAIATSGALGLTATGGAVTLGSGQAGSDATFDATTMVTTGGAVAAGTGAGITVRALDATIGGALRAGRVAFVNRAPATNAFKLGTGTSTGGFQLSTTEVNQVDAAALTFDGGAGNVEIGALAFGTSAGRTSVDVLATGRIDVADAVTGAGSGRTFRLGGSAAVTDKASVIRVATTATGGGRLLFENAALDLRGGRIGIGQVPGFLDALGLSAGGTPAPTATVGDLYVGNANSSLYNSTFGGPLYSPTGATYLSANSLTVRYTDYALFQNTGAPGINAGVALGSQTSPVANALVLQGSGTANPNSFALFGTINGINGTATAVLGPTVISVSNVALATTRVNGCLVGSGAGCITSVVSQPVLNVFDASRLDVFRTADDLALPFDPVIGTNNEALFSGITLTDVPVTATECAAGATTPECRRSQEEPK